MGFELPLADPILQFTLLVSLALVVELTLKRVEVPAVVGLIAAGMLLGPGGLAVVPREPVVELLGSIGLVYIMFLAGLEIDFQVVRRHRREGVTFGLLAFVFSLLPALATGWLLGYAWAGALLIGAAVSSHTLLAYPIIQRLGLLHHRPIVAAVGGTLLTDTLALVLLVVTIQAAGAEGGTGWVRPLLLLGALVACSLVVIPRAGEYFLTHGRAGPAQKALFLLAILLILSAAAEIIGTEDILGAFLAGVCLNASVQRRPDLREHIEFVGRMLFIPFFFVETGMRLELAVFTGHLQSWALAALLLAVIVAGKWGAAWTTGHLFRYGTAARITMTGLALPQAAATLAVALTGLQAGVLDQEIVDAIVIVIFLTCLAGPLVTRTAGRRVPETASTPSAR